MKKHQGILWITLAALLCAMPVGAEENVTQAAPQTETTTETAAEAYAVAPQYDGAAPFAEGYAAVLQDEKWGYIDESGTTVIEPAYEYAAPFSEGHALVGQKQTEADGYALSVLTADGAIQAITDRSGSPLSVSATDLFDENGQPVSYYYVNHYLYLPFAHLLIDYSGKALPLSADSICSDGLVRLADTEGRFVFADVTGNEVISINKEQGDYRYESVYPYVNGYVTAWVRYLPYEREGFTYPATLVLLDRSGQVAFSGDYDMGYVSTYNGEGVSLVHNGIMSLRHAQTRKWGAIDRDGNTIIPFIYDRISAHSEGLAAVKQNGLWGYVDVTDGTCTIEPQYTAVGDFCNGLALAIQNDMVYVINCRNERLCTLSGLNTAQFLTANGTIMPIASLVPIMQNGLYGYMPLPSAADIPQPDETAAWAYNEVTKAIREELLPEGQKHQYTQAVSRSDFAELLMQTLTRCTDKATAELPTETTEITTAALYEQNPFYDTNNPVVLSANRLGLIRGVSADSFAPDATIKRQDAAVLLYRAAQWLGTEMPAVAAADFADNDAIADYAQQAVAYVTQIGIMNGVDDNRFAPNDTYTKEQAVLTLYRLYNYIQ